MKNRRIKNKIILGFLFIVCILILSFFLFLRGNNGKDNSPIGSQSNIDYEVMDAPLSYRNNKLTKPYVNTKVVDGTANITVGAGYGETMGSYLKIVSVSQSVIGAEKTINILINQDLNDTMNEPYNPSIIVKLPKIEPGKFIVRVKINKRQPNFTHKPISMDVIGTLNIEGSFSYSIR